MLILAMQIFYSNFVDMPKVGLTDSEWKRRLKLFAEGHFDFGRGNNPPRNSKWARSIDQIRKCPVQHAKVDLFGNLNKCSCGYHETRVSILV